jgi:hypothetical protein
MQLPQLCRSRSLECDHEEGWTMQQQEGAAGSRPQAQTLGARRAAMRVVQDADTIVLVYEFEPAMLSGDAPTLVFERAGSRRELAQYPVDWRRMSDAQLMTLLHGLKDD